MADFKTAEDLVNRFVEKIPIAEGLEIKYLTPGTVKSLLREYGLQCASKALEKGKEKIMEADTFMVNEAYAKIIENIDLSFIK